MHSIIPHQHSNELIDYDQSEAFAEADGLIDYVKLLFLTDLGEGHMENFEQGENYDLVYEFQVESHFTIIYFCSEFSSPNHIDNNLVNTSIYENDVPITKQYFLSHIDFRGPPTIV